MHHLTVDFAPHGGVLVREPRVIVGIPNEGGFHAPAVKLIRGFTSISAGDRSYVHECDDALVVCARAGDLPRLLGLGAVDIIVTGCDHVAEAGIDAEEVYDLGLHRGVVCVLGTVQNADWRDRNPLTVATQYPRIAAGYFGRLPGPHAAICHVSGATELYARVGAVDVIVDTYVTGATAAANGLCVLDRIFQTSGRIFARPGWRDGDKDITAILRRLVMANVDTEAGVVIERAAEPVSGASSAALLIDKCTPRAVNAARSSPVA